MSVDRYSCPPIAEFWTEEAKLRRWLVAWQAGLAGAGQDETAIVEFVDAPAVHHDLHGRLGLVLNRAEFLEAEYGHDVAATVEALREWFAGANGGGETARWLHYGLCSSDVTDLGLLLACRGVTGRLSELTMAAAHALPRRDDDAVYRTHGQAAQVGRSDHRWYAIGRRLGEAINAVREAVPCAIGFNGPTGNGGAAGFDRSKALEVVESYARGVRLTAPDGLQARDRSEYVTWLQAVGRLATACEHFGTTVRLLSQTGVDEVREGRPATYRGSSSMPHKHNPSRSERLCGLAPVVRGLVAGYAEAASSCWDAHSLEHSSAERVVFPLVTELVGFMLTEVASITGSLECDEGAVRRNIEAAPADSFAAKNALVESGADGGTAWSAVHDQTVVPDGGPAVALRRGDQFVYNPRLEISDRFEPR